MRGFSAWTTGLMAALWFNVSAQAAGESAGPQQIEDNLLSTPATIIFNQDAETLEFIPGKKNCDDSLADRLANNDAFERLFGNKAHLWATAKASAEQFSQKIQNYVDSKKELFGALFGCEEGNEETNLMAQALKDNPSGKDSSDIFKSLIMALATNKMDKILAFYSADKFIEDADIYTDIYIDVLINTFKKQGVDATQYLQERDVLRQQIHEKVGQEHKKLALFALKEEMAGLFGIKEQISRHMDMNEIFALESFSLSQTELPPEMQNVAGLMAYIVAVETHNHMKEEREKLQNQGKYKSAGTQETAPALLDQYASL